MEGKMGESREFNASYCQRGRLAWYIRAIHSDGKGNQCEVFQAWSTRQGNGHHHGRDLGCISHEFSDGMAMSLNDFWRFRSYELRNSFALSRTDANTLAEVDASSFQRYVIESICRNILHLMLYLPLPPPTYLCHRLSINFAPSPPTSSPHALTITNSTTTPL